MREEYDSEDEGMQLLLGGLSLKGMCDGSWSEEVEDDIVPQKKSLSQEKLQPVCSSFVRLKGLRTVDNQISLDNAYHVSSEGRVMEPPVRIVDMASMHFLRYRSCTLFSLGLMDSPIWTGDTV